MFMLSVFLHRKNAFLYLLTSWSRNQSGRRYQNTLVSAVGVQDHWQWPYHCLLVVMFLVKTSPSLLMLKITAMYLYVRWNAHWERYEKCYTVFSILWVHHYAGRWTLEHFNARKETYNLQPVYVYIADRAWKPSTFQEGPTLWRWLL